MFFLDKNKLEKTSKTQKFFILFICDILTFGCMGIASQFIIFGSIRTINIPVFLSYMASQLVVLLLSKYYRIRISDSSVDLILKACLALFAVFIVATIVLGSLYGFTDINVRWSIVYTLCSLVGTLGTRYAYRMFGFYKFHSNFPKTIVYGAGDVGVTMLRMSHKGAFKYSIIGFIDDNPQLK